MSESTFERRAQLWLEDGPTELPADAVDLVMAAIEDVPQERPPFRLFRRSISASTLRLAAAAIAVLITAGGVFWLKASFLDVATSRDPSDLLFTFPDATTVLETSGEASDQLVVLDVGELAAGSAFVLVGSCSGDTGMLIQVYVPTEIQAVPSGASAPPQRALMNTLGVTCDGLPHHLNVGTKDMPAGASSDVALTIDKGLKWRFAIGEYRGLAATPTFAEVEPPAGWYVAVANAPTLITSDTGFGIEPSDRAKSVAVVVQCSGDPLFVSADGGGAPTLVDCDDPNRVTRLEYPAVKPASNFNVKTEGVTWVRLSAEADGGLGSVLPTAPALPPGLADVQFADADGLYLAFGRLGSNEQAIVHASGAQAGIAAGDRVAVATPDDGGGARLDLWSLSEAKQLQTLARIPSGANFGRAWVDASHSQVFYVVFNADFTTEWHRVGLDGSGDVAFATAPDGSVLADGILAVDDSVYVVDRCPVEGRCIRVIHDAATGTTRELPIDGDRTCSLAGAYAGLVVALSGSTCTEGDAVHITVQALDGGPRRVLVEGAQFGQVVRTTTGARFAYLEGGEQRSTYLAVDLDGGPPSRLVTIDHQDLAAPSPVTISMPVPDWLLVGGPLGDTPSNKRALVAAPRLINVITGEVIELVNLPHSEP